MIHKLLKRPQAIIGLCLIAIVIVIAIAAPAFSPHDPELVNLSQKYAQPDAEYPLGTDQLGRCTLSRLLYGARYSIGISLPVLLILSVIGLIVGTFSACAGEKADHFITIKRHMGRSRIKRLRGTNLDIQFLVVAGKALPTRRYSLESVKSKCHRWEKHLFSAMGAFHINCAVISFTQDL